ncbi:flagellar brake protein [Herminiimonas sp. CN]|uniref:flagellar brake protein n=1 Tax=Herminiimonas sp. CN TaxID=1349818 RepID=UPI00047366DD|nr:flagellar brake protein [Herminiimonas sp. CN]
MDAKSAPQEIGLDASGQPSASDAFAALEDFRITHPREVGGVLRQLMNRKDFLTVECGNRPHRIITRILDVDQNAGCFVYDCSGEEIYNRSLLESDENYFSATQDGIRIQFVGGRPEQYQFEGALAFRSPLPQSLYRMQRREFFRVETPLLDPYPCTAHLPDKSPVAFDIFDLSLTGVGLRSKDPTLGALPIGTVLSRATLDFGKLGMIGTDLKIAYLQNIRDRNDPLYHFGCRFERFPKSKEPDLQRMITHFELARRKRKD